MRLETSVSNDRFEAVFSERLTSLDLPKFRHLLSDIRNNVTQTIVFNLAGLEWIDSAGLGMLILAKDLADKEDRELILRSPKGDVKSLLELGRFDKIFTIMA